jgi:hypothetical protein
VRRPTVYAARPWITLVLFYNLIYTIDIVISRGKLALNTIIIKGKVRKR